MTGDYPRFHATSTHEALVEPCLVSPAERAVVDTCDGDVHRHGVAVRLQAVQYLGYFPDECGQVPEAVRTVIAHQLQLLWDHTEDYPWHSRTPDRHLALIRSPMGWRFPASQDTEALETWLRTQGAPEAPTEEDLCDCAYACLRDLGIELPAESELRRIVRAALHSFFDDLYQRVTVQISETVRTTLEALLVVGPDETSSAFDRLKTAPSAPGVQHLQPEVTNLQTLRAIGVPAEALASVPLKVLPPLKRRASHERAGEMRAHPAPIRCALMACFIPVRTLEVTDAVVRMMLEIIRRIETQTAKHRPRARRRDSTRVAGKVQLLVRVAEAVVEAPDGTIREVLFPRVGEATFRELVAEARASGPQYRLWYQYVMRQQYVRHYRRMLPQVLEHLTFRSENRFQPVIEALAAIKRYLGTKYQYILEEVPLDGVVLPKWRDTVLEPKDGAVRIYRRYYALCVLQPLERALKCTEVWVEGSYAFRNPSQDMPADWHHEAQRTAYYHAFPQPVEVTAFLDPLRERLTTALTRVNRDLPRNPDVHRYAPTASEERRLLAVARLTAQPEPQSLDRIKDLISQRYGVLDLLDIFVEADRLTGFTRFCTHSGTKEVRSREALRPLLLPR
jgi:Domain of unknown function (DUF4158)